MQYHPTCYILIQEVLIKNLLAYLILAVSSVSLLYVSINGILYSPEIRKFFLVFGSIAIIVLLLAWSLDQIFMNDITGKGGRMAKKKKKRGGCSK